MTELIIIGWIDPSVLPLAKGVDTLYVVDEEGVDGCTLPLYAQSNDGVETSPAERSGAMLNELLERYWNAAHGERKEGRDHDTEDGVAQRTLTAIHAEVRRLLEDEREACAKMVDHILKEGGGTYGDAMRKRTNAELRGRPLADGPA